MGLAALFETSQPSTISDDQGRWRQFILDHLDIIASHSTTYQIDPPLMYLYRYDLRRFLKSHLKRNQDMGWIVQLLNSLKNDFDFENVETLLVPSDTLILKLYHSYKTVSSNTF